MIYVNYILHVAGSWREEKHPTANAAKLFPIKTLISESKQVSLVGAPITAKPTKNLWVDIRTNLIKMKALSCFLYVK